jgi:membrane-bound inhibitor of C-type lysozyme
MTRGHSIFSRHRLSASIVAGVAVIVAVVVVIAIADSGSTSSAAKAGSNARSGPAAGGVVGTAGSLSTSSFAVSTSAGQKVTVNKTSSTTYRSGTHSTSASAVTGGESVLVLGTTNGTTITATEVVVRPASGGSATYSPSKVVPFKRGSSATSKQDGQIPANYSEGSGTIVSGTTANKATTAALAAYPGGVVDRVVRLSNGEYEVHNIGVNWPHHVFVDKSFKVVGAN